MMCSICLVFALLLACLQQQVYGFSATRKIHYVRQLHSNIVTSDKSIRTRSLQLYDTPLLIDASYNLAAGVALTATVCGVLENFKGPTAKLFGGLSVVLIAFSAFLTYQTTNLRFQFDETNFALVQKDGGSVGENVVVGGVNSWKYSSFVNWQILPNDNFPILVYFKETQTPTADRVEAPIVVDSLEGQAHFFPAITNVQQLEQNFASHNCKSIASSTTVSAKLPTKPVL